MQCTWGLQLFSHDSYELSCRSADPAPHLYQCQNFMDFRHLGNIIKNGHLAALFAQNPPLYYLQYWDHRTRHCLARKLCQHRVREHPGGLDLHETDAKSIQKSFQRLCSIFMCNLYQSSETRDPCQNSTISYYILQCICQLRSEAMPSLQNRFAACAESTVC